MSSITTPVASDAHLTTILVYKWIIMKFSYSKILLPNPSKTIYVKKKSSQNETSKKENLERFKF